MKKTKKSDKTIAAEASSDNKEHIEFDEFLETVKRIINEHKEVLDRLADR